MNINVRPSTAAESSVQSDAVGYMSGFGNRFETKAHPGALPVGRTSPQTCPHASQVRYVPTVVCFTIRACTA